MLHRVTNNHSRKVGPLVLHNEKGTPVELTLDAGKSDNFDVDERQAMALGRFGVLKFEKIAAAKASSAAREDHPGKRESRAAKPAAQPATGNMTESP
jgi:hypothetical protein